MSAGRLDHLDGLRGVASLIVVFAHFVLAFEPALYLGHISDTPATIAAAPAIAATPLIVLFSPELGVAVFFVLSGYVLARGVVRRPTPWPELAIRRWLRLTLPILGSSVLIWCWVALGSHPDLTLARANGSIWLGTMYLWTASLPNDFGRMLWQGTFGVYAFVQDWWNSSLWTMPIEFWCSLALYAAYAVLRRFGASPAIRLLVAILAVAAMWNRNAVGFAVGAALFETGELSPRPSAMVAWIAGAVLLAAGLLLGGAPYWAPNPTPYWWLARELVAVSPNPALQMHRIGAACLVGATLLWPPLRYLLGGVIGRWLGRVSFMTYLLHVAILAGLGAWLVLRLTPALGYDGAVLATLPLVVAAILAAASVASRWIDRPSIALAHAGAARLVRAVSAAIRLRRSAGAT